MANQEQLAILLQQGVKAWNQWREEVRRIHIDLTSADFGDEADLGGVHLHDVDLSGAYLHRAYLSGAHLYGSILIGTNLSGADLTGADLRWDNLSRADLNDSILRAADLYKANLSSVQLGGADLGYGTVGITTFADVDLSGVHGLETVHHAGPSTIGIDTLYKSNGAIPESFLRGAGVPEDFITFARSLVGKPIHFYSCFISHSSLDQGFCNRLYADLRARDVRVWYFPEDATWGKPVWGEIDRSIKVYDKLVVVCSRQSLQSGPVLREIERALNREDRDHKDVLFPIRIDDSIFKSWEHSRKDDVLQKVVGDFSGWDTDAVKYEASLKRLIKALEADSKQEN